MGLKKGWKTFQSNKGNEIVREQEICMTQFRAQGVRMYVENLLIRSRLEYVYSLLTVVNKA